MTALLIDTHILVWDMLDDPKLTDDIRALLYQSDRVVLSTVSLWEITIKSQIGKLTFAKPLTVDELVKRGFELLPIKPAHALAAGRLPLHHRDPFDRMLVAQAQIETLTLVSHDKSLRSYDVKLMLI